MQESGYHFLEFYVNSLRPRRNRRLFADYSFKCIFLNENMFISINISLKFIPKGLINYISALVQIMAWRRPDSLPTHICVTRPQWVKAAILNEYSRKMHIFNSLEFIVDLMLLDMKYKRTRIKRNVKTRPLFKCVSCEHHRDYLT